jgi:hypothetical protein
MKTNLKELKQEISKLNTAANKRYLKHLLSPLEQAVLRHAFQPFRYKIDSVFVYISATACKKLLVGLIHRIQLMNHLVDKDKQSTGIPFNLRETFDDPAIILSLHPTLRNKLCRLECYTMFSIIKQGKQYFIEKGFGIKAMQTIDTLFTKYNCSKLFK